MPPPIQSNAFREINNKLHEAYTSVAGESMQKAAEEAKRMSDDGAIKNITASFDGTWQVESL